MAYSFTNVKLLETPFIVRRIQVTADSATGEDYTHGEASQPDVITMAVSKANPVTSEMSVVRKSGSATALTVDAEGASSAEIVCIWFSAKP